MMVTGRPYVLAEVSWVRPLSARPPPRNRRVGLLGYRERVGVSDLFSVYMKTLEGDVGAAPRQRVKLFALVEAMEDRLPEAGTTFVLSDGTHVLATCEILGRGMEEDDCLL